jgi:ABC-type transport system involved in cytochrome c biogenesis permease subunit
VNFLHELSEPTKRVLDMTAAAGAVTAVTLSQAALMVSILAGLLSIAWYSIRIFDRLKHGRSDD